MKYLICTSFLSAFLLMLPIVSSAQEATATHEAGTKAKTFFVELGGPGFISANYDFRFNDTRNGWGARGGLGYFSVEDEGFFTVPVQINYLLGKGGHYFEMGGGLSYVRTKSTWYYTQYETRYENDIMGTMTFGYRRQPVDGGFNFRAGLSPVIMEGDFIPYLPYVSFGYTF